MKLLLYFVSVLVLLLSGVSSWADTVAQVEGARFGLNQASPEMMQKYRLGTLVTSKKLWVLKAQYNKATMAGTGTVTLLGPDGKLTYLPKGGIVTDCLIDVITAPTTATGGANIALGTGQTTTDLKASTGTASYTGLVACVPIGSAATAIKLTADRTPIMTLSGSAPLNAGKFNVLLQYIMSDAN